MKFKIWEVDKKDDAVIIDSENMNIALDKAASEMGYIDYADMTQEKKWNEEEGLNIVEI